MKLRLISSTVPSLVEAKYCDSPVPSVAGVSSAGMDSCIYLMYQLGESDLRCTSAYRENMKWSSRQSISCRTPSLAFYVELVNQRTSTNTAGTIREGLAHGAPLIFGEKGVPQCSGLISIATLGFWPSVPIGDPYQV